mmetsp:Transcript_45362/g.146012  ORF Transcript_45362/g.146012 Transcript_45362/m.146012 type:complete len:206 (+) Transcript_45362:71-688(+)
MTLPRASSPLLIWTPSAKRSPDAPVRLARSEPARSTKLKRGVSTLPPRRRSSMLTVKIACERDDVAFIAVAPVARLLEPSDSTAIASSGDPTGRIASPGKAIAPSFSRTSSVASLGAPSAAAASIGGCSRSWMSSLYTSINEALAASAAPSSSPSPPATRAKISATVRGMIPSAASGTALEGVPMLPIVCVLPEPVCPYASTVEL